MPTSYNQAGISYNASIPYNGVAPVPPFLMPMSGPGGFGLGCADSYDVFIGERGGRQLVLSVPFTSLEWGRSLDDTSSATVRMRADGPAFTECCEGLADVDAWSHELCIYRNHRRVWAGPLTTIDYGDGSEVTLPAKDLSAWLDRRRLHDTHNDEDAPLLEVAVAYIDDALSVDNSMGLITHVFDDPTGATVTRKLKARENKMCLPELGQLADVDLDWVVIDRVMYLAVGEIPAVPFTTLTDSHFRKIAGLVRDGDNLVTDQIITGQGTGSDGPAVQGSAVVDDDVRDRYGVHERVVAEDDIRTERRATKAAQTRIDLFGEPVNRFTGGQLDTEFPLTIDQLVPGTVMATRLTQQCLDVTGPYRLAAVSASFDGKTEQVSVTMEPEGSTT